MRKMKHHNPNVDLVNNNVYTVFGYIMSMHSEDIEKNDAQEQLTTLPAV